MSRAHSDFHRVHPKSRSSITKRGNDTRTNPLGGLARKVPFPLDFWEGLWYTIHNEQYFKFGFVGERQGSALDPLKPFLEEGFKNPKNFQKGLSNNPF